MSEIGGYKTRQRERILRLLTENAGRHLSVDEVVDHLRGQGEPVGKSTVYRYLDRLVEQGLVRRYFLEERTGACYQYAGGEERCREHFHLKCIGCGGLLHVECSYLDEVAQHVASHHRFAIDHTKTVLYGLCELCAAKQEGVPVCAG